MRNNVRYGVPQQKGIEIDSCNEEEANKKKKKRKKRAK